MTRMQAMIRGLPLLVAALVGAACGEIRAGGADADGGSGGRNGEAPGTADGAAGGDGASPPLDGGGGGGSDAPAGPETIEAAAARLAALRFPGPRTEQGSTVACTPSGLVWRDPNGAMHGWRYDTQRQLDYTFKAPRRTPFASDAFVAADDPTYTNLNAYDATQPGTVVASLPYAFNYAADDTGVVRFDQKVNNVALNGTKVRKWTASTGLTEDISTVLPTPQPPIRFANGKVVIPADVNTPYPLYVVDVATKVTMSVTFDGGIAVYDALPVAQGLLVSYARTGPVPSIRLYKGYDNGARVELGDEVKAIPPLFLGAPPNEHTFLAQIAADGDALLYGSAAGIWAYDMVKGALTAVQLGGGKVLVPDAMCTMGAVRALAYRVNGDAVGQIWVVPLAKVL